MHIENTPEARQELTPSFFALSETACLCTGTVDLLPSIDRVAAMVRLKMADI